MQTKGFLHPQIHHSILFPPPTWIFCVHWRALILLLLLLLLHFFRVQIFQSKMDRRSWPWKKKSSDKKINEKLGTIGEPVVGASLSSLASLGDQANYKKVNYVQISMDSYKHLNGLEDQVNTLKDQIKLFEVELKDLKEDLSAAHSVINVKKTLVMQHAKVAEEAVSGWEKADAEVLALKCELESVSLLKVAAEDQASHLDGALKECMRQIRSGKEESEQKLHDIIINKEKQWDKIKLELEEKIAELDQALLRTASENASLSRSLQERYNLIVKINEEKSEATAQVELLKSIIRSHEKEISSLKYELLLVSKEFDVRNEEKNMSVRMAEIATKQHLEGVKRIADLEAECQRMRGLVRKKLPGPAALAQMKVEIDTFNIEFKESQSRSATIGKPRPYFSTKPEIKKDKLHQTQKDAEFLTTSMLAMEEETNMLKEALATTNCELLASRSMHAKTVELVKSLEFKIQVLTQQGYSPTSNLGTPTDRSSSKICRSSSVTSMSENGIDDSEACAPAFSDTCGKRMGKRIAKTSQKPRNAIYLDLMNDFLEMESLAANGVVSKTNNERSFEAGTSNAMSKGGETHDERHHGFDLSVEKVVKNVKCTTQELNVSPDHSQNCIPKVAHSDNPFCHQQALTQDTVATQDDQMLSSAILCIHQSVLSIGRKALQIQNTSDGNGLSENLNDFSAFVDKYTLNETRLLDFVLKLSHVMANINHLNFDASGYKHCDEDAAGSDYIDKLTLLESRFACHDSSKGTCISDLHNYSKSTSDHKVPKDGVLNPLFLSDDETCKCLLTGLEQLKLEKETIQEELARCMEDIENKKLKLHEQEQLLSELKSQLASSKKLYSFTETKLKCMTESYSSLEVCAQKLEAEVTILREKAENLIIELSKEKNCHQDALARCNNLQDQLQRNKICSKCSLSSIGCYEASNLKTKQETEIVAATEKLAACQETIHFLGKQLQALHPLADTSRSHFNGKLKLEETLRESKSNHSCSKASMPTPIR